MGVVAPCLTFLTLPWFWHPCSSIRQCLDLQCSFYSQKGTLVLLPKCICTVPPHPLFSFSSSPGKNSSSLHLNMESYLRGFIFHLRLLVHHFHVTNKVLSILFTLLVWIFLHYHSVQFLLLSDASVPSSLFMATRGFDPLGTVTLVSDKCSPQSVISVSLMILCMTGYICFADYQQDDWS